MDFDTTRWSVVMRAGGSTEGSRIALEQLCRAYWMPVYAYVRQRGHSLEDAKDLTQEFFAYLIERNVVAVARRERGRFRHFLKAAIRNFLANEWDKAQTQKRGGGRIRVRFDAVEGGSASAILLRKDMTPEALFERAWALTVLDNVLSRLREEWRSRGKLELFDALKHRLTGEELPKPYAELAKDFGMTETAVKLSAHRMRAGYHKLLREEILQTVDDPSDFKQEIQDLQDALQENP